MDEITLRKIRNRLRQHRYGHVNELELQGGVEEVLTGMGLIVERETRLSDQDRIDIMTEIPRADAAPIRLGIEVKIKGPADGVRRQLVRYAGHDQVDALILVTSMYRHMIEVVRHTVDGPTDNHAGARLLFAGKPFEVALLSRGLF